MAKYAVDARVITAERDGVGRYASELVPALAAAAPGDEFLVLRHPSNREPIAPGLPNVREVYLEGLVGRLFDHFLVDHRRLRAVFDTEGWPQLYHALFHMWPLRFPGPGRAKPAIVVTLHDLIWLDYPFLHGSVPKAIGAWLKGRTAVVRSLRRADEVIAVSRATADAARRWLPGDATVVHHGVSARFRDMPPPLPASLAHLDAVPFVAALAESKRYKNLDLLLEAVACLATRGIRMRLVLLGRCAPAAVVARRLGLGDHVLFPGEVDDETLRAVIARAALFVHPAIVEGFGMPVVEAMALGAPTAVAAAPALVEVGGEGVERFDPHDAGALAALIERVMESPATRAEMSARARRRAADFDWNACARATLAVYQRALSARATPARAET